MLLGRAKLTLLVLVWRSLRPRKLTLLVMRAHPSLILLCLLHTLHHHLLLLLLWIHPCRICRVPSSRIGHHIIRDELALGVELTL